MDAELFYDRTRLLMGEDAVTRFRRAHVLVLGLGGVGGWTAEFLARAGVGALTLVDADCVEPTNLNRQNPALHSTLGLRKTDVCRDRLLDINPDLKIRTMPIFVDADNLEELFAGASYDAAVDAIDTVNSKTAFLHACFLRGIPVVSSMGAGGRLDPSQIRTAKLSQTVQCALARAVRRRFRELGFAENPMVVFSTEAARPGACRVGEAPGMRPTTGTISYMPCVFGCHVAAAVLRTLAN